MGFFDKTKPPNNLHEKRAEKTCNLKHATSSVKPSMLALARIAAIGSGSLVVIDDVTAD